MLDRKRYWQIIHERAGFFKATIWIEALEWAIMG